MSKQMAQAAKPVFRTGLDEILTRKIFIQRKGDSISVVREILYKGKAKIA